MPTQKFHYIDDIFCCHEVPLETIAEQAGTPSYVYSGDAIRENYRAYDRALAGLEHDIHYAVKANSSLGFCRFSRRKAPGSTLCPAASSTAC